MDDLFGLIVVIIIACVSLSKKSAKNKQKGNKPSAAKPVQTVRTPSMPKASAPAAKPAQTKTAAPAKSSLIEQELLRKTEELKALTGIDLTEHIEKKPAGKAAAKPLASGESFTDKEGCIGGSLNAHTEEGESHSEHAEHMKRMEANATARSAASEYAAALKHAQRADLRRAVIMSEILDKPVALRKR